MKRLADYTFTDYEIQNIFGSRDKYRLDSEWYGKNPAPDTEKYLVAHLLFLRGEREESRKMIESIEDEEYRYSCLEDYAAWGAPDGTIIN